MHKLTLALAALALTACSPPIPDSGKGVGFEDYADYNSYSAAREAELSGAPAPTTVLPPARPETGAARPTAADVAAAAPAAGTPEPETAPRVAGADNPGISDENDFSAVAERESIQSDRERLAAQREAYKVIEPTALPARSGDSGPNIVAYALQTTNQPGQKIHRRSALSGQNRYVRNCGKYPSPDLAQEAFLQAGGPGRDKLGLDPDGDGFACAWDPRPFRRVTELQQ